MEKNKEFKPYIPAEKVTPELTVTSIVMGVIRILMRRNSILESNMVQTIGSAGESLAAGAIFTLPALLLWASEG